MLLPSFMQQHRPLAVLLLACFYSLFAVQGQSSQELRIEYVGNMGVAITRGDTALLIDALHDYYEDGYLPASTAFLDRLLNKRTPYKVVPALMVTHLHNDHFDSALVRKAMEAHREARVIAGRQLGYHLFAGHRDRYLLAGAVLNVPVARNIEVKLTRIKHTYQQRHASIDNYRIEVVWHGKRIVHLGDALSMPEALKDLGPVDVLIVPYWHFMEQESVSAIEQLKPKRVVLTHVSPRDSSPDCLSSFINPIVFTAYGQNVVL